MSGWSVSWNAYHLLQPEDRLVVIHNFNLIGSGIRPKETDAILVVDSDAMLPLSISNQRFQPITRRNSQFVQCGYGIKLVEFSSGDFPEQLRTALPGVFGAIAVENPFRTFVLKRHNHADTNRRVRLRRKSFPAERTYWNNRDYFVLAAFHSSSMA